MTSAVVGYLLIVGFFALEFFVRRGSEARSLDAGATDRGTTVLIGLAYTVSIVLSPLLNFLGLGRRSGAGIAPAIGIGMMVLGLGVRIWAMLTLGGFYTRTLKVSHGQTIVDGGPYRLVRHPGYLGTLLTWIGLPLTLANWLCALIVGMMMAVAYWNRMLAEESMLVEAFGEEYRQYMRRTRRLVPFIF